MILWIHLKSHNQTTYSEPDKMQLSYKIHKLRFITFFSKALFTTKRARPDIHTAVSFISMQWRDTYIYEWKKLDHIIRYQYGTPNSTLRKNVFQWWLDRYHGVHSKCRWHMREIQSLGKGSTISISTKKNLNTRSSTETDLVSADEIIP